MKFRLISFVTCPYVQRARIALLYKRVVHETTFIELSDKPDWFLDISPRGKVPVLLVDNVPVFESSAICDLLEELVPAPALFPTDPVLRARDRAWFVYGSEDLFGPLYRLVTTAEEQPARAAWGQIAERLARLAPELEGRHWLSGDGTRFGMADVSIAPFFWRLRHLREMTGVDLLAGLPLIASWSDRLCTHDAVASSPPAAYATRASAALDRGPAWVRAHAGELLAPPP